MSVHEPTTRLEIRKTFSEIQELYREGSNSDKFNALIYGHFGTGKTSLAMTCPKPVLIHSFDPQGTDIRTMKPFIENGDVLVQRFEDEEPSNPTQFMAWQTTFERQRREGFFEHIGTFMFDSLTTFADAVMNSIMKNDGVNPLNAMPKIQHYGLLQARIKNLALLMTALPCHSILTGHLDFSKDEQTGSERSFIMVSGKSAQRLPMLFEEVYVTQAKSTSRGTEYSLLTQNDGKYLARTRIGSGIFDKNEAPDIKALLKKAGKNAEDKT